MSAEEYYPVIGRAVGKAMGVLLTEKHLYQAVDLDLGFLPDLAKRYFDRKPRGPSTAGGSYGPNDTMEDALKAITGYTKATWSPYITGKPNQVIPGTGTGSGPIMFELPTINTYCSACESRPPFNPVPDGSYLIFGPKEDNLFCLRYVCQQCKEHSVCFLVRREESKKLRLCGRDPLETIPSPTFLPKAHRKFYGDAAIAHHAGQTLAGIFLLRVFVEQFWRSRPEVKPLYDQDPRIPGEKLGEAYQQTLPQDFRARFPSLTDVYSDLSAAMHEARGDAGVFEGCQNRIEEHFDARRLFKL